MTLRHEKDAKNLTVFLYDKNLEVKFFFTFPQSLAAPAINRILREAVPDRAAKAREPWYQLIPHCVHEEATIQRAASPVGESSLLSDRYDPEREPFPRVHHHPKPHLLFFTVIINDFQEVIFKGQFSVDDLFHASAEYLARKLVEKEQLRKEDAPYFYKVEMSQKEASAIEGDLFPEEAYRVEGVFHLPKHASRPNRISFKQVASPPLPVARRKQFGPSSLMGRGRKGKGLVLLRPNVYQALQEMDLSEKVENGGYLLGVPYSNSGDLPETSSEFKWTLEVTDLIRAESSYGSPALLLFNGDTWSQMRRTAVRDYPDKKIVSWFHTHLFAASDDFGLSGLDQDLHRQYFPKPWQVAILINIDARSRREIRCFQKGPRGDLLECKFEVLRTPAAK